MTYFINDNAVALGMYCALLLTSASLF